MKTFEFASKKKNIVIIISAISLEKAKQILQNETDNYKDYEFKG